MIESGECSAIVIESSVNPRSIVQPILEACSNKKVPALCLNGLRKITTTNFGIRTTCLGIKTNYLPDLKNKVGEIARGYKPPQDKIVLEQPKIENMEVVEDNKNENVMDVQDSTTYYLYRTDKKTRVFTPPDSKMCKPTKKFVGQNFIEFSEKSSNKNVYMKMMVKRISNNPNRGKVKSDGN